MKLFRWKSEAMRGYARGDVIVMAPNLAEARQRASMHAMRWAQEHRGWWFNSAGVPDADGIDDYQDWATKFAADLDAEPELIEPGVILISGSE